MRMSRLTRTLLFSTLFPSSDRPVHGIFVETRLRKLLKTGEVETIVVTPLPWSTSSGNRFGEYGCFAATPYSEQWDSIDEFDPLYVLPAKVSKSIAQRTANLREILTDGDNTALIDEASRDIIPETLTRRRQAAPFRQQLSMAPRKPIDRLNLTRTGNDRRVVGLAEEQLFQPKKAEIT